MSPMSRVELPVVGEPAPERADASRNRQKILEAARRLFAQRGLAEVTMETVAGEAGVGKGRSFGGSATAARYWRRCSTSRNASCRSDSCAGHRRSAPARPPAIA